MKSYVIECTTAKEWEAVQEKAFALGYNWRIGYKKARINSYSREMNALWLNEEGIMEYSSYVWYQTPDGRRYTGKDCIFTSAKSFLQEITNLVPIPNGGIYF